MKLVILAMTPAENPPPLKLLHAWAFFRKCTDCVHANMKRPDQKKTHPPTSNQGKSNGTHLALDGTGAFFSPSQDGETEAVIFTCEHSKNRWCFPVVEKTAEKIVGLVRHFQAHSPVQIRAIRTDNEFMHNALKGYCDEHKVKLTSCAPHVHQQNPIAESSVKLVKYTARVNELAAKTGRKQRANALKCACVQLNKTPTISDPTGRNRSPMEIWPEAPFSHTTQVLHTWGQLVYGHVGRKSTDPNSAARSKPGIFVGFSEDTSGYLVYHHDCNRVLTYAYLQAIPNTFPCRQRMMLGEDPDTPTDGEWRQWFNHHPMEVPDVGLIEYVIGKQIQVVLPQTMYPAYKGRWMAVCTSSARRGPDKTDCIRLAMTQYIGPISDLTPEDHRFMISPPAADGKIMFNLMSFIDIPVSTLAPTLPDYVIASHTLRELLAITFPHAPTMADMAAHNVQLTGHRATRLVVRNADEDVSDDEDIPPEDRDPVPASRKPKKKAQGAFFVLPARVVGGLRSSAANWRHHKNGPRKSSSSVSSSANYAGPGASHYDSPDVVLSIRQEGQIGFEPHNINEAMRHATWPIWQKAIKKETDGLLSKGTWIECHKSDVPDGVKIMQSQFVFKDKPFSGAKARLVVRGDMQDPKPLPEDTYAPCPSASEVRMLISVSTQRHLPLHQVDMTQAFTQSDDLDPKVPLYIYPPHGAGIPAGIVWKLVKPLYGLCVAPKAWADTLKVFIKNYGFKNTNCSDTFFVYDSPEGEQIQLVFHVDDLLFNFTDDALGAHFKHALLERFDGTDMGPVKRFVGVDITRDDHHTHLTQRPLAESLLNDFNLLDSNSVKTPMIPGTLLTHHVKGEDDTYVDKERYQHLVGTLMFLCTWTRPDLVFATQQLAKFSHDPHHKHMEAAKRVLRYLKGTIDMGITYSDSALDANRLIAFCDADWASCVETRRSYSGFVALLNGGAIQWKTTQQKAVATSTAEAEFVSASKGADEIVWLNRILTSMGHAPETPTPVYEDNRACRMMSENPVAGERSKHIDYRVFALRERVADGHVRLLDCPTHDMLADIFTKNLCSVSYVRHRTTMLGDAPHTAPKITTDLNRAGPRVFNPKITSATRPIYTGFLQH